jgi:hypothetical protein
LPKDQSRVPAKCFMINGACQPSDEIDAPCWRYRVIRDKWLQWKRKENCNLLEG